MISVALSGNVPERTLLQLARDLKDDIKAIPTVLDVDIDGERKQMLEILIDPVQAGKLWHLAAGDVHGGRQQQQADRGRPHRHRPGQLRRQGSRASSRTPTTCSNLPIRSTADATVTLGDVAQVRRTFYDATTFARVNGQPTISLDVSKRIGSNIIANNKAVRDVVDQGREALAGGRPRHLSVRQSQDIRDMLGSLSDSIILAIVLVMIIIVGRARRCGPACSSASRSRPRS